MTQRQKQHVLMQWWKLMCQFVEQNGMVVIRGRSQEEGVGMESSLVRGIKIQRGGNSWVFFTV
jgi:hypothetical protein